MFFDKHRLTFICIPKNAGTSISKFLGDDYPLQHRPWQHYAKKDLVKWQSYTSFAVIRNPWDRLTSLWRWWSRHHPDFKISFPEMIEDCANGFPYCRSFNRPSHHWETQSHFIHGGKIDILLRFETLNQDWNQLFPGTRLEIHNQTKPSGHYSSMYTKELADIVADRYRPDIDLGGYRFSFS